MRFSRVLVLAVCGLALSGCLWPSEQAYYMQVQEASESGDFPLLNATATRTHAPLLAKAFDEARNKGFGYIHGRQDVESTWDFLDEQFGDQARTRRVTFEGSRFVLDSASA
jgi:hypothetical protein